VAEVELLGPADTGVASSSLVLNASAIGAMNRRRKRVIVDTGDQGIEHSLVVDVSRGPVVIRIGSTVGDDDYVPETSLGTGYHSLSFTPGSEFHITLQTSEIVNRRVESIRIGDSGTVEIPAPWRADDL